MFCCSGSNESTVISHTATFCDHFAGCLHGRTPRQLTTRRLSAFENRCTCPARGTFSHRLVNTAHHHKRFYQDFVGTDQTRGGDWKFDLTGDAARRKKKGSVFQPKRRRLLTPYFFFWFVTTDGRRSEISPPSSLAQTPNRQHIV